MAIVSLILGIVSILANGLPLLFMFTWLFAIGGMVLGIKAINDCDPHKGCAIAGIIISSLTLMGWLVVIALIVLGITGISFIPFG